MSWGQTVPRHLILFGVHSASGYSSEMSRIRIDQTEVSKRPCMMNKGRETKTIQCEFRAQLAECYLWVGEDAAVCARGLHGRHMFTDCRTNYLYHFSGRDRVDSPSTGRLSVDLFYSWLDNGLPIYLARKRRHNLKTGIATRAEWQLRYRNNRQRFNH